VLLRGKRRLAIVVTSALTMAGVLGAAAGAQALPPAAQVSFSEPTLSPSFAPDIEDYVVRCQNAPVTVQGHASGGWQMAIGNHPFRSGDFSQTVSLGSGRAFVVSVRQGGPPLYRYHVRCLPNSFPPYTFKRFGPVSPKYFVLTRNDLHYAMIFNDHGVPIWWIRTPTWNARVLSDGTVLWYDPPSHQFQIHRLDGSLVRALPVGQRADGHDLQFLGGDHLGSSPIQQSHVDTSAYGGSSDATVKQAELQQVSPSGQLVWDWKTQDHISLAETGRWWPRAIELDYDLVHWNSIQPVGSDSVIASFRHLDAVYKIDKSTGAIVWKLGGTSRPASLNVIGDPLAYTFGGQHDARLLPDGTVTVFDNRTNLGSPRAVRFRIDETAGTATLLQSITDPSVTSSGCCGSARRLGNGDWLINWAEAQNHPVGGYKPNGQRTFLLTFPTRSSYRAEPVPSGAVSAQSLRQAMNARCSSGCS
jgi:Arylsulfotransferase (ASST)